MKKRTVLILCLVLAVWAAVKGPALWDRLAPIAKVTVQEFERLLSPQASMRGTLKVENRFLVRSSSGGLTDESNAHLDLASYADDFDWLPSVPVSLQGRTYLLWDENRLSGAVDKFLTAENTGDMSVFFRTCIAIPRSELQRYIVFNRNTQDYLWTDGLHVTLQGVEHVMYVATYKGVLAPGETAPASLLQMALQKSAPLTQVVPFNIRITTMVVAAEGFDQLSAPEVLDQTMPLTAGFNPFQ